LVVSQEVFLLMRKI